jgi:hypothetical protein
MDILSVGEPVRDIRIPASVRHETAQNRCTFTHHFKEKLKTNPDYQSGQNRRFCRTLMYAFVRQISPQIDPQHREIKRRPVLEVLSFNRLNDRFIH